MTQAQFMYAVLVAAAVVVVALLGTAVRRERAGRPARAIRRPPWLSGLVLLGLGVLATALFATDSGDRDAPWMWLGAFVLAIVWPLALIHPRWAGLWLLGSAALLPLVGSLAVWVGGQSGEVWYQTDGRVISTASMQRGAFTSALLLFSLPAAVAGGLLVTATMTRPDSGAAPSTQPPV